MKKTSKSRMKKLPILLGTLLIISVAAYGTRAYFSDSASQQADIKLELGNIDINSVEKDWFYTPERGIANSVLMGKTTGVVSGMEITKQEALNITNVQPGDQFTRIFTFENVGTLEQKVTVDNTVLSDPSSIFDVKLEQVDNSGNVVGKEITTIKNNEFLNYKMTISVKTEDSFDATHNQKNGKVLTGSPIFNALADDKVTTDIIENAVNVTANQVNK